VDNAPYLRPSTWGLTIEGYSRAGQSELLAHPGAENRVDLGRQPWTSWARLPGSSRTPNLDHSVRCAIILSARRRMMRMEPPTLRAQEALETSGLLVSCSPGSRRALAMDDWSRVGIALISTLNWSLPASPRRTRLQSLGYIVWDRRHKLNPSSSTSQATKSRLAPWRHSLTARASHAPLCLHRGPPAPRGWTTARPCTRRAS